jgi:hypothetical protein
MVHLRVHGELLLACISSGNKEEALSRYALIEEWIATSWWAGFKKPQRIQYYELLVQEARATIKAMND